MRSLGGHKVSRCKGRCVKVTHFIMSCVLPASEAPSRSPRLYDEFVIGLK